MWFVSIGVIVLLAVSTILSWCEIVVHVMNMIKFMGCKIISKALRDFSNHSVPFCSTLTMSYDYDTCLRDVLKVGVCFSRSIFMVNF
jgi:hypothetical protein